MSDHTDVTVAIITYFSEKYVTETLDSIYNQSYKNIELIISDDGSKDATVRICEKWLEVHKHRFVNTQLIVTEKNTGIPGNCNRALIAAESKWLKILAGDDALKPDCITHNMDFIQQNAGVTMLQSQCDVYRDVFEEKNYIKRMPAAANEFFDLADGISQYRYLLKNGNPLYAPSVLLSVDAVRHAGGFDESFPLMEDYPLWLNLTRANLKFHFLPVATVNYRLHVDSVTKSSKPNMSESYAANSIKFIKSYLARENGSFKLSKEIFKYKVVIFLNRAGMNNSSQLSKFLFRLILAV